MKKIGLDKFVRHLAVLASGTVAAQAIVVLVQPIVSRLYTPGELGEFAAFSAMIGITSVLSTMRYEYSIVLPPEQDDECSKSLLGLVLLVTVASCLAIAIPLTIYGHPLANLMGLPQLGKWLWMLPLSLLVLGWSQGFYFWGLRQRRFRSLTLSRFCRAVTTAGVQLGAGIGELHAFGLILGQFFGQLTTLCTLVFSNWSWVKSVRARRGWHMQFKHVAYQYRQFPQFSTPQNLLNTISQSSPIFLLGYFFGASDVGYYALADRLLQLPANLVGESIREIFYQQSSQITGRGGSVYPLLKKATLWLCALGCIPFASLVFFGPQVFSAVLGNQWLHAGSYARFLSIGLFFSFINPPSVMLFNVYGMQKFHMFYELGLLIFRVGSIYIGSMLRSDITAICMYTIVGLVFNLGLITYMFSFTRKRSKRIPTKGVNVVAE